MFSAVILFACLLFTGFCKYTMIHIKTYKQSVPRGTLYVHFYPSSRRFEAPRKLFPFHHQALQLGFPRSQFPRLPLRLLHAHKAL